MSFLIDHILNERDINDLAAFKKLTGLQLDFDDDFDCEVVGEYQKGTSRSLEYPGDPECFENISVYVGKFDVTHLILSSVINDLNDVLLRKHGESLPDLYDIPHDYE